MNSEILAIVDVSGGNDGVGSWSVAIHVGGEPVYSAAGTCTHTTRAEMEETAYTVGLRWIGEHFPETAVSLTIGGKQNEEALASEHLDRLTAGRAVAEYGEEVWPVLMKPQDIIPLKVAIDATGKADRTLRGWCRDFGIGRQSGPSAPHEISYPALEMVMHGDMAALEMLRAGERKAPRVVRYFRHLGIDP